MSEEEILAKRAEKFKSMGIPQPIAQAELQESAAVSSTFGASKDTMSKLEMIKRGALKNDFRKIINKAESGEIVHPNTFQEIPVNRGGGNQSQKVKTPTLENYAQQRTAQDNEAMEMERMLYGGGSPRQQQNPYQEEPQYQPAQQRREEVIAEDIYSPPPVDYRAALEKRLKISTPAKSQQIQEGTQDKSILNNTLFMKKLTELETRMQEMVLDVSEQMALKLINEMTTEIATEVAKKVSVQTTKNIILEFGKSGKTILVESAKVKRAEVIDTNKVKIDGKIYKLTEVKA